jgi:chromate transport protein ChrA
MRGRVLALLALGWGFSVVPSLVATVVFFPVFLETGESGKTISLLACLLLALALLPLWRSLAASLRSPSAWKIYLFLFIFFFLTERIASEMVSISLVGFLSSLVGAVFFRLARRAARERRGGDGA